MTVNWVVIRTNAATISGQADSWEDAVSVILMYANREALYLAGHQQRLARLHVSR